jgi:hypothetical protein
MTNRWKVIYYENMAGRSEVFDFIESRDEREQLKIMSNIALLRERGPNLPRPYADLLTEGIHELRVKLTGKQMRILYFFCYKDFIVLTNIFEKHSDRVPLIEIKKAKKCREDYLNRACPYGV